MQLLVWVSSVVLLLPDSSSGLTGPKAVSAVMGSSVSVVCCYDKRYQGNRKHWCRRVNERNCVPVISTTGSEQPMIKNRVSIRDNHSLNNFTVTMANLSSSDSGIYSCAVRRAGGLDLMTPVNVTVLSTPQMTDVPDNQVHGCSFQKSESNTTSYQIYVPFLVSICLKLPIFLTLVLAIIWMHRRNRQHSDEATAPERQP